MKTLVTGARGLVGSAIVRQLNRNGYGDVLVPSHSELDLLDERQTLDYMKENRPDMVICCAAKVGGIGGNSRDNYGFLV